LLNNEIKQGDDVKEIIVKSPHKIVSADHTPEGRNDEYKDSSSKKS